MPRISTFVRGWDLGMQLGIEQQAGILTHLSFVATEVVHVCLAIPQTSNLIPKNRYNYYCGCCLVDVADSVDVAMVTVVSYY